MTEEMTYVIQEMKKVDIEEITRDEKCTDKITKIWENEMDNDMVQRGDNEMRKMGEWDVNEMMQR